MNATVHILLTGHATANMEALRGKLEHFPDADIQITERVDSLAETDFKPDVLVHFLGDAPESELEIMARLAQKNRPATLIVFDQGEANIALMRLAMQAGARDFVMGQQVVEDTLAALRKILREERFSAASTERVLTAVVNAKGGAGASTIACALAHALASRLERDTLLLDLDVQFGSQSLKLDAHPEQGIIEALNAVESLDQIALAGYVAIHSSGLHVLGALTADLILPGEVKPACLSQLIQLIQQRYEQTVVDLPRLIDPLFSVVMEKADHAIVVLQQDIASLKDALRLIQILIVDLDMPVDRILPVVNRYEPFASIKLVDVERTLGIHPIATVPNDYRNVHTAEDLGIPLAEYAPRSPATLSIYALAETLSGLRVAEKRGLLKQFLTKLWSGA